jgi:N6-adenosine-specific RNA methylase IME4
MQLKINEEFQALIPPLSEEELNGLEESIIKEGCREALVTWNNHIIDGHNRYAICTKHNITFKTIEAPWLKTVLDVEEWMVRNQIARRNLTTIQKAEIALKLEEIESKKAKLRQLSSLKQFQNNQEEVESSVTPDLGERQEKGEALEIAAKTVGLGYETVRKAKKVLEKASEEVKQDVRDNKISIDNAYRTLQKQERQEALKVMDFPTGSYRVIYADPPWKYSDDRAPNNGGATEHYPTMSIEEICNMPVRDVTDDNAVLFLWTTSPMLEDSFKVINSWGFKYKSSFVWDKVKPYFGHYNSVTHELLLIATKGSCTPDISERFDSVQTIEKSKKHSEKPEEFRNIIETMYTYGNKIELFARKKTEDWEVYGNEL